MKTTLERMQTILADQLGLDEHEIKPESRIADLGADSLDAVEIVMAVEEEWNLTTEIDDEEAMKIETVDDAVKLVDSIISANVRDHQQPEEAR